MASGLPAVGRCNLAVRSVVADSEQVAATNSAVDARSNPPRSNTGRPASASAASGSGRMDISSAIGSASSRRATNPSVSAEGGSSRCASSTRTISGVSSAYRLSKLSVAAPTAKRSVDPPYVPERLPGGARGRADRRDQPRVRAGGLFQIAHGTVLDTDRDRRAARTGDGRRLALAQRATCSSAASGSSAPIYHAHLVDGWLPALDGVVDKLERGRPVADVGCGHGASTILMAQAFPALDLPSARTTTPASIADGARSGPQRPACPTDRVRVAPARRVLRRPATTSSRCSTACTTWATRSARRGTSASVIADDGTWMIVEPAAGDRRRGQPQPGRTRLLRVLDAAVHAVVARAGRWGWRSAPRPGPARIRDVVTAAGFTQFRLAAQTPFNNVLEVRPVNLVRRTRMDVDDGRTAAAGRA